MYSLQALPIGHPARPPQLTRGPHRRVARRPRRSAAPHPRHAAHEAPHGAALHGGERERRGAGAALAAELAANDVVREPDVGGPSMERGGWMRLGALIQVWGLGIGTKSRTFVGNWAFRRRPRFRGLGNHRIMKDAAQVRSLDVCVFRELPHHYSKLHGRVFNMENPNPSVFLVYFLSSRGSIWGLAILIQYTHKSLVFFESPKALKWKGFGASNPGILCETGEREL